MATRTIHLGLTGGIGSGKSTVASLLQGIGATLVDADAISRNATCNGGAAIAPIKASFGPGIFDAAGALDRNALRHLIFSNPTTKSQLEAIVHPIVRRDIMREASIAEQEGARCIVFDIPLLVESPCWRELFNRILVVDCTEATQITRVVERSSLRPNEIHKIICTQATRAQRLNAADITVFNEGITIAELERQVHEIAPQFGL